MSMRGEGGREHHSERYVFETREFQCGERRVMLLQTIGNRHEQQDAYVVKMIGGLEVQVIADGHGDDGYIVADMVAQIIGDCEFSVDEEIFKQIKHLFDKAHVEIINNKDADISETRYTIDSTGGTVITLFIRSGDTFFVAYAGDVELRVYDTHGTQHTLFEPHDPSNQNERDRIRNIPGVGDRGIVKGKDDIERVVGTGLTVTRAVGHRSMLISCKPDIHRYSIEQIEEGTEGNKVKFFILASDGLWKRLKDEQKEAFEKIIRESTDEKDCSDRVQKLLQTWELNDNVTILISPR